MVSFTGLYLHEASASMSSSPIIFSHLYHTLLNPHILNFVPMTWEICTLLLDTFISMVNPQPDGRLLQLLCKQGMC
jgi:hypothetical protein